MEEKKKKVENCEDLLLAVLDTEYNYPIYIDILRNISIKKRLEDVCATFFVKELEELEQVEEIKEKPKLLEKALKVTQEVTGSVKLSYKKITFEVYAGDLEKLIGEAHGYVAIIDGKKYESNNEKRAWAVAFEWKKRCSARENELEKFTFVKGERVTKRIFSAWIRIKLPVKNRELEEVFNKVFTYNRPSKSELREEIEKIKRMIEEKEKEVAELKEKLKQLEQLLMLENIICEMCRE